MPAIIRSGPMATHRFACHNPATDEEAEAGRPLRRGLRRRAATGRPSGPMCPRRQDATAQALAHTHDDRFDRRHRRGRPDAAARSRRPLLEVSDLHVHFKLGGGFSSGKTRRRPGRRRRRPRRRARRDARARRRIRLRQDDHRPGDRPAPRPDVRLDQVRRRRDRDACKGEPLRKLAPAVPDDLPGPVLEPESADDRRRDRRRAARRPRHRLGARSAGAWPRAARDRRPQRQGREPVPARVQRRPAPAHRRRAGARAQPGPRRRRRADQRARRLDPRPDPEPARAAPDASSGCRISSSRTTSQRFATSATGSR